MSSEQGDRPKSAGAILSERQSQASRAFDLWSLKKSRYDRGLLLLSSLETEKRLEDDSEGAYKAIVGAMVATDASLNLLHKPRRDDKTMKKAFYSWCLGRFTFHNVKLSQNEINGFTKAYRSTFLQEIDDPSASPSADANPADEDEDEGASPDDAEKSKSSKVPQITVLPSVTYIKAKKPSAGDNAKIALRKALTPDQQMSNTVFSNEFRRRWRRACLSLYELAKKELVFGSANKENDAEADEQKEAEDAEKAALGEDAKEEDEEKNDEEQKSGDQGDNNNDDAAHEYAGDFVDLAPQDITTMDHETFGVSVGRWRNFLYKHGVQVLEKMLEYDEDKAKEIAAEKQKEKEKEADDAYRGFLRKKDMTRIRMPDEPERVVGGHWKPPRMDFSSSSSRPTVRPKKTAIPTNTIELMRGQGLKYVHALRVGKNGMEADLEKCQKKLLEDGYVYKENFKDNSDSDDDGPTYEKERKTNKAIAQKRQADKMRKLGSKKMFERWRTKKEMCERATKSLHAIDPPQSFEPDEATQVFLDVGKALKSIDRNLYFQWVEWAGGFVSNYKCQVLWDYFPPKCCDIHSAAYSGMRDTFLKLLRPGLDYVAVFNRQCRRKWVKLENLADESETKDLEDFLKEEFKTDEPPSRVEDALDLFELNKKDMSRIMKDLGLKMEGEQLRRLIDAFDTDGSGTVNKKEFISFCCADGGNARPAVRGDTAAVLERKCIFETTCCFTGMPNAFVVTAGKSKKGKNEAHCRIIEKQDGTIRRIVELEERRRRWNILKQFGICEDLSVDELIELEDQKPPAKCEQAKWDSLALFEGDKNKQKDDDDNDYDDDAYDDDFDDSTAASSLRVKKQRRALDLLLDLSASNRAALTLKKVMDEGKPPPAPQLWSAEASDPDVRGDSDDTLDTLTDALLLRWRAQPGSLVAFFSLEMSGALGSKEHVNNEFREILRDPPNADSSPKFQHFVDDLEPNTTYTFRIRAFNGFGGGPYIRKEFTTQPVAPATPVLVRASTNSVTIKWKFGDKAAQFFAAFKRTHKKLAETSSVSGGAAVNRIDLMDLVERSNPELLLFLRNSFVNTTANNGSLYDVIMAQDDDNIFMSEIDRAQELVAEDGPRGASNVSFTRTKYVVEQSTSQAEDTYEQVWRGSAGEAMIKGLESNMTYRLRVFAVNIDGLRGHASQDVVVNTLLDTPNEPKIARGESSIGPSSVNLTWAVADLRSGLRMSGGGSKGAGIAKVLSEWTRSGSSGEDNGLSLDMIFSQFDRNGSGKIDGGDLMLLLNELGVNPSEERLREVWSEVASDAGDDVSFDDFQKWWGSKSVTYVLRRERSGESVHCYRGSENKARVEGLLPNTKYNFTLRVLSPNSCSKFSSPLKVHTAPLAPSAPAIVSADSSSILLKLTHGNGGGHKFILERRLIKSLNGKSLDKRLFGWQSIYEGVDPLVKSTGCLPACLYHFRAKSANSEDMSGASSEPISAQTREKPLAYRPANAPEVFTVECSRDIVVGDLILFTERMFMKDGKLVTGGETMTVGTRTGRDGSVTPRLSLGSTSGNDRGLKSQFVGERTVAARVLSKRSGSTTQNTTKLNRKIVAMMCVVWSSVSDKKKCGKFVLREGLIVERTEDHIFSFETFRALWDDETMRDR